MERRGSKSKTWVSILVNEMTENSTLRLELDMSSTKASEKKTYMVAVKFEFNLLRDSCL